MSGAVLIVSLGTTDGWLVNERELSGSLARLGVEHRVVRLRLGPGRHLRRTGIWPLVDAVEAAGARRALGAGLREATPAAVIVLSTTASLLVPVQRLRTEGVEVAIRVDCPSSISRPGVGNFAQRALERRSLRAATLVLATGPRSAALLSPLAPRVAVVPVPVEPAPGAQGALPLPAGPDVVVYAADPDNKGLDLVCRAWWALGPLTADRALHVTGVSPERGRRLLLRRGVAEPPGLRWHGRLPREDHIDLVSRAAAYVSASAWEGAGIAQLEALAVGVPLVTTPSLGAYEAYGIAGSLAPDLVAPRRKAGDLAEALEAALAMPAERRARYAAAAAEQVLPFSRQAADRALEREVVAPLIGAMPA